MRPANILLSSRASAPPTPWAPRPHIRHLFPFSSHALHLAFCPVSVLVMQHRRQLPQLQVLRLHRPPPALMVRLIACNTYCCNTNQHIDYCHYEGSGFTSILSSVCPTYTIGTSTTYPPAFSVFFTCTATSVLSSLCTCFVPPTAAAQATATALLELS